MPFIQATRLYLVPDLTGFTRCKTHEGKIQTDPDVISTVISSLVVGSHICKSHPVNSSFKRNVMDNFLVYLLSVLN